MVFRPLLGIFVLMGLAWIISEKRGRVDYRDILTGIGLQFAITLVLLRIPPIRDLFGALNRRSFCLRSPRGPARPLSSVIWAGRPSRLRKLPRGQFRVRIAGASGRNWLSAPCPLLFYWPDFPSSSKPFLAPAKNDADRRAVG